MVRALFSLSLLSATMAFQVADMHEHMDYDGMKSAMVSMAKHIAKDGIDQGTQNAINGFLDTIKNTLLPSLDADRQNAQNALDAAENAVNKCNEDRNSWVKNGLNSSTEDLDDEQGDHDDCRMQEQVTLNNYTGHCSTLQSRVCNWENCDQPSFAAGDTDAVDTYICCMHEFFNEHRTAYWDELKKCNQATALHHAQTALCDAEQEEFEGAFCTHEDMIQKKCKWYDNCRCTKEAAFEDMKKDVEDLEKIFQTQFVALQHLVCYGEKMLTQITDLSGCDSVADDCEASYTECPKIVYPTPQDFIPCNEPHGSHPCDSTWTTEFYGWFAENQPCTPMDDCIPCTEEYVLGDTYTGARVSSYASCDE